MAWAWLGWITLSLILFPTLVIVARNGAWDSPYFDTWGQGTLRTEVQESGNRPGADLVEGTNDAPNLPAKESAARGKGREPEMADAVA
jgi:hypothetical protein